MFESLSDRLTGVLAGLRSKGRLTDADIDATAREIRLALLEALGDEPGVHLYAESTVEEVGEGYVLIQNGGRLARLDGVDSVVIGGRTADNTLADEIARSRPEIELYTIGDAVLPRDMYAASHEAADAAELIHLRAVG